MWANRPPIRNGMMEVSTEPGFGIRLDWEMVKRYRAG
jgi:D-arabinonate dehydratase